MAKSLLIFVEGLDDRRFVEKVIDPRLKRSVYSSVQPFETAQRRDDAVNDYVDGLNKSRAYFDYLFLADKDAHVDLQACRDYYSNKYPALVPDRIFMVCAEIESWYLAGVLPAKLAKLGIRIREPLTDAITKEKFIALLPARVRSQKASIMLRMLDGFNLRHARSKNRSFKAFCDHNQAVVSAS